MDQSRFRQLEHFRSQCRPEIVESEAIARDDQIVALLEAGRPDAFIEQIMEAALVESKTLRPR